MRTVGLILIKFYMKPLLVPSGCFMLLNSKAYPMRIFHNLFTLCAEACIANATSITRNLNVFSMDGSAMVYTVQSIGGNAILPCGSHPQLYSKQHNKATRTKQEDLVRSSDNSTSELSQDDFLTVTNLLIKFTT
jgi:hypothetical protein